ncbi:fasciclin domain-containing protein [Formosa haliotis]|uniref:fasciclin domain-containing protein n=1 Tax=Formosa haliotis TaxID=1555194 RepID=UPI000826B876|nr:fasciclin domain-containing protein [Formosa haliotis]
MKNKMKYLVVLFSLFIVTVSCNNDDDSNDMDPAPTQNIIKLAQDTDNLSSLVAALTLADTEPGSDLIGTLSGDGPFTVFAPSNQAFTDLLNTLEDYNSLSDFDTPEGRIMLATILKYHAVSGATVLSSQLEDNQEITTVQGETLMVDINDGVFLEDATETKSQVTVADVMATNGVVHIVNKVLVPQAVLDEINRGTLVDIALGNDDLSILAAVVVKTGLVDVLNSDGPFTVFAPTNEAFVNLLDALGNDYNSLDDFDTEAEIELLRNIVLYHAIPSAIYATDLTETSVETAFSGNNLDVVKSGDTYVIQDATGENANIIIADVKASNGVAHVIDRVLLPN